MRTAGLLVVVLSACAGRASSTPSAGAREASVETARLVVGPVTLLALESGDRSCDVFVRDDDGKEERRVGMHLLCADAAGLLGQRVVLTVEQRAQIAPVVAITAAP